MKTIIEVEAFGDFDVMYTVVIMVSEEKIELSSLQNEFCQIEGIASFKGVPNNRLYETTENYIAFLKLKGFKALATQKVYFCD